MRKRSRAHEAGSIEADSRKAKRWGFRWQPNRASQGVSLHRAMLFEQVDRACQVVLSTGPCFARSPGWFCRQGHAFRRPLSKQPGRFVDRAMLFEASQGGFVDRAMLLERRAELRMFRLAGP